MIQDPCPKADKPFTASVLAHHLRTTFWAKELGESLIDEPSYKSSDKSVDKLIDDCTSDDTDDDEDFEDVKDFGETIKKE